MNTIIVLFINIGDPATQKKARDNYNTHLQTVNNKIHEVEALVFSNQSEKTKKETILEKIKVLLNDLRNDYDLHKEQSATPNNQNGTTNNSAQSAQVKAK